MTTANSTKVPGQQNTQLYPLISRDVPAFASPGGSSASYANNNSYDTNWEGQDAPAWLAYDLSGVPASERSKVLVVWYNETGNYDHTIIGSGAYDMPQDYTIDVNSAGGRGQPPRTGWVTLVAVRGNHYHSRQHVINITSYNWIRINVTSVDGSPENYGVDLKMDVFDASAALADDWIFFGDSITAGAMDHRTIGGVQAFAQLIHAKIPAHYPAQESGGVGYLTSADGAKYLDTWLGLFPGKYVALSYGTNDALGCDTPADFYNNYAAMVQDVLSAGKIPVVPHIPWGRNTHIQNCASPLNAAIDRLYRAFPQIIRGPDLWAFFQNHQNLISSDGIHPWDADLGAYRQQWANAMLAEVYSH